MRCASSTRLISIVCRGECDAVSTTFARHYINFRQGFQTAAQATGLTQSQASRSRSAKETSMRKSFIRKGAAVVVAALIL